MDFSGYQICHVGDKPWSSILKEKRVVQGMTQQQVADRARIKIQQYQKFESGERSIMTASFQLACRVIEALGMDVSDFYHGAYVFGEEIYLDDDGKLKYAKSGKDVNEDV